MLLSEMFGVERGETFEIKECADRFMVVVDDFYTEFLRIQGHGKGEWVYADTYAIYQVIKSAPTGIIHLPPPLTDEQRGILRALYTLGYRWLAKDGNGATYAYDKQKLAKGLTVWLNQERGCSRIHDGMAEDVIIPLVSWSDPEPFDIGKALGVEG